MSLNFQISDVGHVIQLAIAPVFLLTGVATTMSMLMSRLGRIIDRARVLKEALRKGPDPEYHKELNVLNQRWQLINYALTGSTGCAFLICVVIACLFVDDITGVPLDKLIAAMFVLAMVGLILSFCFLLREVFVSFRYMRMHLHEAGA